jgi:hypothetical protein
MKITRSLLVLTLVLLNGNAQAQSTEKKVAVVSAPSSAIVHQFSAADIDMHDVDFTEAQLDQMKTDAKARKESRKVASTSNLDDRTMSEQAKAIRNRFLNLDSPAAVDAAKKGNGASDHNWSKAALKAEALDSLLYDYATSATYDTLPDDAKLMVAGVPAMIALKSVVYRVKSWLKTAPVVQSASLTVLRQLIASSEVYFPGSEWDGVTAYLTEPMNGMRPVFHTDEDYAQFLRDELAPALQATVNRLQKIKVSGDPLIWDNQLSYSKASFQDGLNRFRLVGAAEVNVSIAALYSAMANLAVTNAYTLDGVLNLAVEQGNLIGIDGFKGSILGRVEGATARDRANVLNSPKYAKLFVIRTSLRTDQFTPKTAHKNGTEWMHAAWGYLKKSWQFGSAAWDELKDRPAQEEFAINSAFLTPFKDIIQLGEANLTALARGSATIRSAITGEFATIDLRNFFGETRPADLKKLAPIGFDDHARTYSKTVINSSREIVTFNDCRNYDEGSATRWNVSEYAKFSDAKDDAGVKRVARVLSQAFGGSSMMSMAF